MSKPTDWMPFSSVKSYITPLGEVVLEWVMEENFPVRRPIHHFYVELSRGGEWSRTNTEDIEDCIYVDANNKIKAISDNILYRVVAVDDSGGEYASPPHSSLDCLSYRQWKIIPQRVPTVPYARCRK